ncbi:MAG: glycosyltransferase family 39 protein [Candidatus Aenigmarchaeota archaeon]|nr:glycosyltransferase family 39 protein [Candidatus Aenigmarchaeota archaeon]
MKHREKRILLASVAVICLARIASVFFSQGIIYDELSYMGIARSLNEGAGYGYVSDPGRDGWRPPLWPFLLSLWLLVSGSAIESGRLLSAFLGIGGVAAIYFLGKKIYGEKVGLYSSLFLAVNPSHWFFSTKALVEPLLLFLEILFVLALWLSLRDSRYLIPAVMLLPLLFMVKYTSVLFWLFFCLFLLVKKRDWLADKNLWIGAVLGLLIMSPWIFLNTGRFGSALGPASWSLEQVGFSKSVDLFYLFTLHLQLAALLPFSLIGLYMIWKKRTESSRLFLFLAALLILVFIVGMSAIEVKRERYIMPVIPPMTIAAAYFFGNFRHPGVKSWHVPVLAALIIAGGVAAFLYGSFSYPSAERFISMEKAGHFLSENCSGKKVYGEYPYVFWFTRQRAYQLSELGRDEKNICVLFDGYVYSSQEEKRNDMERLKDFDAVFQSNDVRVFSG